MQTSDGRNDHDIYARRIRTVDGLVPPHGGELVQAFVPTRERAALMTRARDLPCIAIDDQDLLAMEMIASGAFSPLTGFMCQIEYESVLQACVLPGGLPWGLPVTLAVTRESALTTRSGEEVALWHDGKPVGVMRIEEVFPWDPVAEVRALTGSEELSHPWVSGRSVRKAAYLLGGRIALLAARGARHLQSKHQWPLEMRSQFAQRGWRHVAVPHLRNTWRRTHEYLLKCALEAADGLLLHSPAERNPPAEALPPDVLAGASRMLIEGYFPVDRVIENPVPAALFALGARSALQHAILSQNYGCSDIYFLAEPVAREGDQVTRLLTAATEAGLGIRPVFMRPAFHCEQCGGIATERSCPHDRAQHVDMSDAQIVERLRSGEHLPAQIARPEIARALARTVAERTEATAPPGGRHIHPHVAEVSRDLRQSLAGHKAAALWMTGLSGSGKSTIAHRLERDLLLSGHRVYVVDGDTLRNGLNRDLAFSEEDRRENLRRAAELVKVMVDAGLLVIASFISPFRAEREMVATTLGSAYREVYVHASLEACEQRDPKGLYKRARAGQIPQFTGISSPYEEPVRPDLRLDTICLSVDECVRELRGYLDSNGMLRAGRDNRKLASWPGSAARGATRIQ
jgi:sulfate adenylyltransferase